MITLKPSQQTRSQPRQKSRSLTLGAWGFFHAPAVDGHAVVAACTFCHAFHVDKQVVIEREFRAQLAIAAGAEEADGDGQAQVPMIGSVSRITFNDF